MGVRSMNEFATVLSSTIHEYQTRRLPLVFDIIRALHVQAPLMAPSTHQTIPPTGQTMPLANPCRAYPTQPSSAPSTPQHVMAPSNNSATSVPAASVPTTLWATPSPKYSESPHQNAHSSSPVHQPVASSSRFPSRRR